ncbi:hypothetical protein SAMN05192568_1023108 [Methylobacterium pseudosasicola]|uniref:Uncharacterized protein n=1 Tax=Methylobacterium pseudosasicola TaxID=582667 RepID=A0A1I4P8T3_9HYPH|nr:hypothetical protein SAMN05192568_1023108 [Methylobacterium pseudosasicola]
MVLANMQSVRRRIRWTARCRDTLNCCQGDWAQCQPFRCLLVLSQNQSVFDKTVWMPSDTRLNSHP